MLFIPAHEERFIAKAHLRGAEAIILDLEDSVPSHAKNMARSHLGPATARLKEHGLTVIARVNRDLANCVADIKVAVSCGVEAVMLPKVAGSEHVALIDEFIGETEVSAGRDHGAVGLLPLIETPAALAVAGLIASASPRNIGLALGTEDFSVACGFEPTYQNLFGPCQQLIFGCRSHLLHTYGLPGGIANFADVEGFRETAFRGKEMGFAGVLCVHPAQVAVVNEVFRPTEAELANARRVVATFDEAAAADHGAVALDGSMIDLPIVMRAKALLEDYRRSHA